MIVRLAKAALVAAIALFFTIVALGNVTDYGSNFAFVQHVLSMDTTFQKPALMWRAIESPALHHAAYGLIILWQIATAVLCWVGSLRLLRARRAPAAAFNGAKSLAVLGLVFGLVLYLVGFLVVAGEWFAMWQSKTWNGQDAALIFLTAIGLVLIYLSLRDEELVQP